MDGCQGEEWEGEGWTGRLGLVDADYLEWINNEVLSTGNYAQYPVISHSERMCIVQCMCITDLLYSRDWHNIVNQLYFNKGFPGGSEVKNLPANAGDARDAVSISGLGRYLGAGDGNPLQYSCLENSMDRGAWWATVHGATKSQT
ncbi:unnamed protein product [Rangifer tarandus platyrhynchus]|uniref:Uncharacterized protein n=2 Tax=Rangifer tarandus platyrhynchus TaxID=3082113 RepID=A0ABN8ZHA7_RANTA|nr:unnamed protein product [Rangifer tarandus platyrhynchus]